MALETHYRPVITLFTNGRVVPFFGAGVNLCDRPPETEWKAGKSKFLPSGTELAEHLAQTYGYQIDDLAHCPNCDCYVEINTFCAKCSKPILRRTKDLARVSQYIEVKTGQAGLYGELHKVFNNEYDPTSLHRFFAEFPALMRKKGYSPDPKEVEKLINEGRSPNDIPNVLRERGFNSYCSPLLIVTTNYDDLMEQAFYNAGEPFDVLSYVAHGNDRGKFLHWPAGGGEARLVSSPNTYGQDLLTRYPVILKMHGAVVRKAEDFQQDHYVITEDHYIDYLTRTVISDLLPATVVKRWEGCSFLFLGYGLRDSNLNVILHRIKGKQKLESKSWAIQTKVQDLDKEIWAERNIQIIDISLDDYVHQLREQIEKYPSQDV